MSAADPNRAALLAAFKTFDKDESGTLTFDELVGVFTRPGGGAPLTEAEARAFIAQHDKNGDGVLSIDEFVDATLPPPSGGAIEEWQPAPEPDTLPSGAPKQVLRAASPAFMR